MRNKIALVTGSSRGIGKAIADAFESNGMTVVRNGSSKAGDDNYVQADVSTRDGVVRLREFVQVNYGKLDVLVNNAAYTTYIDHRDLPAMTDEIFDKIYNTNLRGPFMCMQELSGLLQKSDDPSIINIASVAGVTGKGSNIAYCAMKSALINMTMTLARSLAPVRVNAISPGLIETDFVTFPDGFVPDVISKTPLKRSGQPGDIGDVALSLVNMKFVTGENIIVDGGITIA